MRTSRLIVSGGTAALLSMCVPAAAVVGPAPDASEFRQIRDELWEGLGEDIEP